MGSKIIGWTIGVVVFVPLALLFLGGLICLNGWCVQTIWNWIAVPAFGAPKLTLATAIAAALIVETVNPKPINPHKNSSDEDKRYWIVLLARYPFALLYAYILKGFL